jgi:hypothetical protein
MSKYGIGARGFFHLSPCGRGIDRLRRPFLKKTPKQSFGYVASPDAIRVRGYAPSIDLDPTVSDATFELLLSRNLK